MSQKGWLRPTLYLIQKEFRQVFRDKAMLRIIFAMPLIQLFVLSYAATQDVRNVRLAIFDEDRTTESRELAQAFYQNDIFVPVPKPGTAVDLSELVYRGRADIAVWIPRGFGEDIAARRQAQVSIAVDGTNSSLAGRSLGYAEAIVRSRGVELLEEWKRARPELAAREHRIEAVSRFFYNPELESRWYMVPAIMVILLTVVSGMLTGMAVVREKEIGTLEQLMVTPLSSGQIIVGKVTPFAVLSFAELAFAVVVALFWFRIPLEGSLGLLAFASFVYLLVSLGIGLLASTISHTQQQAMLTIWFILVFGIMTSGFFYPIENMPRLVYLLTFANPLRYFVTIIRGIFLKGSTLPELVPDLLPLALIGVIVFAIAALRFHKRLA